VTTPLAAAGVPVAGTVSALKALDVSQYQDGQLINLLGYVNPDDRGGGLFRYLHSSATEDGGIVFTPDNGSGHFERLYDTTSVRAEWFGADRTGQRPAQQGIQLAIDYALQRHVEEVTLGDGTFVIDDALQLGYGDTSNTVSLVGAGPCFEGTGAPHPPDAGTGFPGTLVVARFKDRPAIAIQGARYSAVKNLTLRGATLDNVRKVFAGDSTTWADQLIDPTSWVGADFLKDAPNADSQHAPYAGIAIDPYSGIKSTEAYPQVSYPSWITKNKPEPYPQYGKKFSSGVLIENVHILGFVVGIVHQPNEDANGDFTGIHRCFFEALKYGISIGGGQSRNVSIRDCVYRLIHTFLTNSAHGNERGRLDGPIENIAGGDSYQFADLELSYSGAVVFKNVYFESQIKFGRLGGASFNAPVVFDSCSFGLSCTLGPPFNLGYNPDCFICTPTYTTLNFTGCNLSGYGKFMNLTGEPCTVVFDCCTFLNNSQPDTNVPDPQYTPSERIAQNQVCGGVYCDGPMQIGGAINSTVWSGSSVAPYLYSSTVSLTRGIVHQGAERLSYTSNNYSGNFVPLRARQQPMLLAKEDIRQIANIALTGDTLTFTNPNQDITYQYTAQVGDLIVDKSQLFDPSKKTTVTIPTLFVIDNISGKVITAKVATNFRIKNGIKTPNVLPDTIKIKPGGIIIVIPSSCFKTDFEYRGDTTAGSTVIANVRRPDGYSGRIGVNFAPGDLLFHSSELWDQDWPFPEVTRIVSVDPNAAAITVDQAANRAAKGVRVGMLG
jgi:hypothetical protein